MEQQDIPKIDAHAHLFYDRDFLLPLLEQWNMRAMVINITGRDALEEPMPKRWRAMLDIHKAHPERIALCTTFDPAPIGEPEFAERTIDELRRNVEQGAVMVKVWKDIGLEVKNPDGSYVQIDDPRFQPIWDYLIEAGVPVVAHIAEPRASWQPLDERSPHYAYYRDNPKYHFYKHPEAPSWETVIGARDRWVEQNPDLTIIGAHLGSMAYDIDEVARRFDRYPNFHVDTAERFGDLAAQPSDRVREFFIRYQDRILYGTDVIIQRASADAAAKKEEKVDYQERIENDWKYLTGNEVFETTYQKFVNPVQVQSLHLPRDVLEKIYSQNAMRWLKNGFDA
jgi:predicted TIM-barrel fold metal-dependent hydrolase